VDLDFVTGEVRNSQFTNNAGDGLDLSGSRGDIINNRFEYSGDKGLSVGENSHPIVVNALFRGNQIGTSVKDLSHAQVANATFVGNVLAVEAKRKKPFFGGGSGEFINSVFAENRVLLEEDYFSRDQVSIQKSLIDDQSACPTCQAANIDFKAPETGDFTLSAETLGNYDFDVVQADWARVEGFSDLLQIPGFLAGLTR
jgi:hypothetical protein